LDLEAYDAAVRAAIATGRLARLQPAVLGRLIDASVLTLISTRAIVPGQPLPVESKHSSGLSVAAT